jgi:hypothetical protein
LISFSSASCVNSLFFGWFDGASFEIVLLRKFIVLACFFVCFRAWNAVGGWSGD